MTIFCWTSTKFVFRTYLFGKFIIYFITTALLSQVKVCQPNEKHGHFTYAVADPGFPVGGGVDLVRGAVDPRGGYVSKILHVKNERIWTRRGGGARRARPPLDPPMIRMSFQLFTNWLLNK